MTMLQKLLIPALLLVFNVLSQSAYSDPLPNLGGSGNTPSAKALAIANERLKNIEQMLETSMQVIKDQESRNADIKEIGQEIDREDLSLQAQVQIGNVIGVRTLFALSDIESLIAANTIVALKASKAEAELLKLQLESADYKLDVE